MPSGTISPIVADIYLPSGNRHIQSRDNPPPFAFTEVYLDVHARPAECPPERGATNVDDITPDTVSATGQDRGPCDESGLAVPVEGEQLVLCTSVDGELGPEERDPFFSD